jgi:hypothetical protein
MSRSIQTLRLCHSRPEKRSQLGCVVCAIPLHAQSDIDVDEYGVQWSFSAERGGFDERR